MPPAHGGPLGSVFFFIVRVRGCHGRSGQLAHNPRPVGPTRGCIIIVIVIMIVWNLQLDMLKRLDMLLRLFLVVVIVAAFVIVVIVFFNQTTKGPSKSGSVRRHASIVRTRI